MNYLEAKINLVIFDIKNDITNIFKNTLSDTDIKKVENKLVKLQLNLFEK
jgi:hypothetical protein